MRDALDAVFPAWNGLAVAGRTDTGVHATGQVASVRAAGGPPAGAGGQGAQRGPAGRRRRPPSPRRRRTTSAPASLPARVPTATGSSGALCAPPFEARRALWWPKPLDRAALDAAAALLPGTHDFTAFTPTETEHTRFERTVLAAAWEEHGDELHLTIEAVSFLRHMCRILVGSMLEGSISSRCSRAAPAATQARPPRRGGCTWSASSTERLGTIEHMRFPVVLFDFDGTVIDSGSIIIASMRHATKTVLGRDIPDEELGRAVGRRRVDRADAHDRPRPGRRARRLLPRAQRAAARRARRVCGDDGRPDDAEGGGAHGSASSPPSGGRP